MYIKIYKLSFGWKERENESQSKVKNTILTGKIAGKEEHHGEDDQEGNVRLQDSCECVKKVKEGEN